MSKIDERKGVKIIQKGILGHLGHLFFTYARTREEDVNIEDNAIKLNRSETSVPSVPTIQCPYWRRPDGSCYACGSWEVWRSDYKLTCARCHPPASPELVKKWISGAA